MISLQKDDNSLVLLKGDSKIATRPDFQTNKLISKLVKIALQNKRNFIQIPVEPQPHHPFAYIRSFRSSAAFWVDTGRYEIRTCPWGKPGSILRTEAMSLKISCIEAKSLHETKSPIVRQKDKKNKTKAEAHKQLWDQLFSKHGYSWYKNPIVWCIYFENLSLPSSQSQYIWEQAA